MRKVEAFNRVRNEKSQGKERRGEVLYAVYLPPAIFKAVDSRNIDAITDNSGTSSSVVLRVIKNNKSYRVQFRLILLRIFHVDDCIKV